jgi:hypothetical protein
MALFGSGTNFPRRTSSFGEKGERPTGRMASRSDIYRARAAECEATAARAVSVKIRATFTELAAHWRNLARQIEMLENEEKPRQ